VMASLMEVSVVICHLNTQSHNANYSFQSVGILALSWDLRASVWISKCVFYRCIKCIKWIDLFAIVESL
jgi:hypothetical protein